MWLCEKAAIIEGKLIFKGLSSNVLFREKIVMIYFIFIWKFVVLITSFGYISVFTTVLFHSSKFYPSSRKGLYGVIMLILLFHNCFQLQFKVFLPQIISILQYLKKRRIKIFIIHCRVKNNFFLYSALKTIDSKL